MDVVDLLEGLTLKAVDPEPAPLVPGRKLHIDGDMLAYLAGGGAETSVATSRAMFYGKIGSLLKAAGTNDAILHITVSGCLKGNRPLYSVTQPYQFQRVGKQRPKNWQYIRDLMEVGGGNRFKVMRWDDREADDGLGFASAFSDNNVITSGDKDMQRLSGWHVDWVEPELFWVPRNTYEYIGPRGLMYGDKWLLMQCLMGDDADHIPGMGKGYGPAYAAKVLAGTTCKAEGLQAVRAEYEKKFGGAKGTERLAEQLFLLYIRETREGSDIEWFDWIPDGNYALLRAGMEHHVRVKKLLHEAKEINDAVKNNASKGVS